MTVNTRNWKFFSLIIFVALLFIGLPANASQDLTKYGQVDSFEFRDHTGNVVTADDLKGKVWVADFIFSRCSRCSSLTKSMRELRDIIPEDVVFVSFSVDPDFDTSQVLSSYADGHDAQRPDWLFLTGSKVQMYNLIKNSFHLGVEDSDQNDTQNLASMTIMHSLRFVLVDQNGEIRGYYDGMTSGEVKKIRGDVMKLQHPAWVIGLPLLNALLNGTCVILLFGGFAKIKMGDEIGHKKMMLSAFGVSTVFLTCYLYYHYHVGSVRFQSLGAIRTLYFCVLIPHTILAALNVPLIITTIILGLKNKRVMHRKFARFTFPIWVYVSVTGVIVYWMLYHLDVMA
ncbi:MAG: DUF420 domain-containing protein [Candidatus Lindowbacteria bacterium]|nr:DUF420 domain-containing protein [Candidatus Lindowbacteria bacterium]